MAQDKKSELLVRNRKADFELREESGEASMPMLSGYMVRFNEWTEIESRIEGHFLERIAPGAAKKTLRENGRQAKILFDHGMDPTIGDKPLINPNIVEVENGVRYEGELFDTSYNRDLVPLLKSGVLGSSFQFRAIKDEWDDSPEPSRGNPKGIPQRTVTEFALFEGGPVVFPAYKNATAGARAIEAPMDTLVRAAIERDRNAVRSLLSEDDDAPSDPKDDLHTPWAILPEFMPMIAATAHGEGRSESRDAATAALRGMFFPEEEEDDEEDSVNGVAVISLRGVITPRGSLFCGGSLENFREQLGEAVSNENVKAILLDIDSPGGRSDLVAEAAAEIRAARDEKQIVAVANARAASAAYWLASQASEVVVTPSGEVGSVGVFMLHEDFSQMDAQMGVKTTLISAGKYKTEGNPYEPLSDEAKEAFQDKVNEVYDAFLADLAKGRGTTVKDIQANFGEGRMVGPKDAVSAGMADRIESREEVLSRLVKSLQGRSQHPTQETRESDDARPDALQEGAEKSHSGRSRTLSGDVQVPWKIDEPMPPWRGRGE